MKLISLGIVVALLGLTCAAFAETPATTNVRDVSGIQALKDARPHGKPVYAGRVGGEDIANAVPIPGLPFTDTGNTCQFLDNYDEVCPYTGSTSADVVYSFTPASNVEVDISLCNSSYDTKVYVRDVTGMTVACNDDYCSGPNYGYAYLSFISCLSLAGGQTYYIIVDGYGGDCGEYILDVTLCVPPEPPCELTCPQGAYIEQEPIPESCGVPDIWNGGCNSSPPVFEPLLPTCSGSQIVCGTAWYDGYTRDTDWYEIILTQPTQLNFCVMAQFPVQLIIIQPFDGCNSWDESRITSGPACEPVCLNYALDPATYWLWVGPTFEEQPVPCGWEYVMTVEGYFPPSGPSAIKESTWGTIKNNYKKSKKK